MDRGRVKQHEAAQLLEVCERTFRRYCRRFDQEGLDGLIDRRLAQVSHRLAPIDEVMAVCERLRSRYVDKVNLTQAGRAIKPLGTGFMQPTMEQGSSFVACDARQFDDILCEHFERTVDKDNGVSFEAGGETEKGRVTVTVRREPRRPGQNRTSLFVDNTLFRQHKRPRAAFYVLCRLGSVPAPNAGRAAAQNFARPGSQCVQPCQVRRRRMAKFWAQPEGTGQILRAAVLLVVHLHEQISLLAPCCAQNLAPSRPRLKREQP